MQTLLNYTLLAFVATAVWAPLIINLLYKFNLVIHHRLMKNKMNEEFIKIHGHKGGTPRSGGLMIAVPVIVLVLVALPDSDLRNVFLAGWVLFLLYGLGDDLIVSGRKVSDRLRLLQETFAWRIGKLLLMVLFALIMLVIATSALEITSLTLLPGWEIPVNAFTLLVLSFAAFFALFGIDLTDGADGLVTGQFMILYVVFGVLIAQTASLQLFPYLGLLLGASLVYLYFNINPARVFMGGTGTLPIGYALLLFTLITDTLPIFFIVGFIFWVEVASSAIQVIAIRFFKRKVFRIAPIHHHFEAIGWPETKVVQRFWLAAVVFGILGLWFFVSFF